MSEPPSQSDPKPEGLDIASNVPSVVDEDAPPSYPDPPQYGEEEEEDEGGEGKGDEEGGVDLEVVSVESIDYKSIEHLHDDDLDIISVTSEDAVETHEKDKDAKDAKEAKEKEDKEKEEKEEKEKADKAEEMRGSEATKQENNDKKEEKGEKSEGKSEAYYTSGKDANDITIVENDHDSDSVADSIPAEQSQKDDISSKRDVKDSLDVRLKKLEIERKLNASNDTTGDDKMPKVVAEGEGSQSGKYVSTLQLKTEKDLEDETENEGETGRKEDGKESEREGGEETERDEGKDGGKEEDEEDSVKKEKQILDKKLKAVVHRRMSRQSSMQNMRMQAELISSDLVADAEKGT